MGANLTSCLCCFCSGFQADIQILNRYLKHATGQGGRDLRVSVFKIRYGFMFLVLSSLVSSIFVQQPLRTPLRYTYTFTLLVFFIYHTRPYGHLIRKEEYKENTSEKLELVNLLLKTAQTKQLLQLCITLTFKADALAPPAPATTLKYTLMHQD